MMGGKVPTGACCSTFLVNSGACAPSNQYFFFRILEKQIISYFWDTSDRASNFTNKTWRYSLAKPVITLFIWSYCGGHGAQKWTTGEHLRYSSSSNCCTEMTFTVAIVASTTQPPHYYCHTVLYQANSISNKNNFQKWRWNTNFWTKDEIIYCQPTSTINYIERDSSEWRIK